MFETQNRYQVLALSEDRALILGIEAGILEHLEKEILSTTGTLRLLEAHAVSSSRLVIVDVDLLRDDLSSFLTVSLVASKRSWGSSRFRPDTLRFDEHFFRKYLIYQP